LAARAWWWAVVYTAAALGLAHYINRDGIGITSDTVWFMSATKCLAEGRGFRTDLTAACVQTPSEAVVTFPPGYPALCALFVLAGMSLEMAMLWGTTLSYAVTVGLTFLFARGLSRTAWMPHVATVMMALFAPYVHLATNAWSESTYLALSVASLWLLSRWVEDDRSTWRRLVAAGVLTALTSVTRFLGVSVFITGLVAVHLRSRREGQGRRHAWIKPALVYGLVTCIPVWTLITRNYVLRGSFTGVRPKPGLTIRENVSLTVWAVADDFCPYRFPDYRSWRKPALAGFWCGVILLASLRRGFWRGMRQRLQYAPRLHLCLVYSLTYMYVLICMSTLHSFDVIGTRLLGPTYLFLGFVVAVGVEQWLAAPTAATSQKWLCAIGTVLLAAGAIGHALKSANSYGGGGNYYAYYANSPTTKWLKEHVKPGEPVFSSVPEVAWFYGRIPTKHPPRHSAELDLVRQYLQAMPESSKAYVVVYNDETGQLWESLVELVQTPGMTCAAALSDAKVMVWRPSATDERPLSALPELMRTAPPATRTPSLGAEGNVAP